MAQVTSTEKSLVHLSGISRQCYCPPPPSLHYLTFKWAYIVLNPKCIFLSVYFNEGLGLFRLCGLGICIGASWPCVRARLRSHLILLPCPQFPRKEGQGYGWWGNARLPTDVDSWEMGGAGHATERICPVVQTYPSISPAILQLDKAKTCPNKLYYAPNSHWIPVQYVQDFPKPICEEVCRLERHMPYCTPVSLYH